MWYDMWRHYLCEMICVFVNDCDLLVDVLDHRLKLKRFATAFITDAFNPDRKDLRETELH